MPKISLKNISKETPKLARRIGNAMLSSSVFALGYTFITGDPAGLIFVIIGAVGKFITTLFAKNEDTI